MLLIPALRRQRQADLSDIEASLDQKVNSMWNELGRTLPKNISNLTATDLVVAKVSLAEP